MRQVRPPQHLRWLSTQQQLLLQRMRWLWPCPFNGFAVDGGSDYRVKIPWRHSNRRLQLSSWTYSAWCTRMYPVRVLDAKKSPHHILRTDSPIQCNHCFKFPSTCALSKLRIASINSSLVSMFCLLLSVLSEFLKFSWVGLVVSSLAE